MKPRKYVEKEDGQNYPYCGLLMSLLRKGPAFELRSGSSKLMSHLLLLLSLVVVTNGTPYAKAFSPPSKSLNGKKESTFQVQSNILH